MPIESRSQGRASAGSSSPTATPSSWDALRDLKVQRVLFRFAPEKAFRVPPWPGSMLRGAIISAFDRLASEDQTFARNRELLFPAGAVEAPDGTKKPATSPVFIEWELGLPEMREPGQEWAFEVVLVGRAADAGRELVAAVIEAARAGLGRELTPQVLTSVAFANGKDIRTTAEELLKTVKPGSPLRLHMLTPTCVTKTRDAPTFGQLVEAADRRARELARAHLGIELVPLAPERLQAADQIRVDSSRLQWIALKRTSASKSQVIPRGGHVGVVTLEGRITDFAPEIASMLVLHVGRLVSHGHGRIALARPLPR